MVKEGEFSIHGPCLLHHNSNAPEQNHPYSSMHSQHCIALRFCDKWWSFRASTETSFNRHWDTSIHHHSSIDGNPKTDYTHHKNDLLESSDSDSVSDLCRTFLQEVFDTLITFPNWNTTTTADWSWPPKCPGFVVGTCLFFWLICGIAQQSSCRLCVSWTGNRSFPAADPAFVRDSTVDCANYPRMSKTKRAAC